MLNRIGCDESLLAMTGSTTAQTLTLAATFRMYDGYGSMGVYMAMGLGRAGASVNCIPLVRDLEGTPAEFQRIIQQSRDEIIGPVLYFCGPCDWMDPFIHVEELFINTMWEGDLLPASWTDRLNHARAVIVPSRYMVDVCVRSGVRAPVEVVAQGVDPDVYRYEERPERAGLTTLIVGTVDDRKHLDIAIKAWKIAFEDDIDARLIIKSRFGKSGLAINDQRISLSSDNEISCGIAHWYRRADVLLALGNEGFGLPLVEGMATGLPVIALNSEGQADICEDACDYVLPVSPRAWEPAMDDYWGQGGKRAVPGVDDVVKRLRWVATHREEARDMGRDASNWVLKNRNIWAMGPAALAVMEHYAERPQSLRLCDSATPR